VGTALSLLVLYVALALGASFLCSLLEAVLLSSREADLAPRAERGDKGAELLLTLKRDRVDDAISAILTLNTIAHTVGAAMAGAQAAIAFGDVWVGVFSGVLTLLILVVSEIVPKTLGTVHAARLAGFTGRTTWALMRLLAPILLLTRFITRLLVRGRREPSVSGRELAALVAIAARQGTLRPDVSRAVSNLLRFDEVRVQDVMTPRTVAWMLPVDATAADLLADPLHRVFSRVPLYRGSPDHVEGYVIVREVLSEAAQARDPSAPLASHKRRARIVPENITVGELLRRLIEWREQLAIAVDEFGGLSGIVTMEDAVETLLGQEILDEADTVADLRAMAVEVRDRRMRRREHGGVVLEESSG
jgi:CBS domain containing-hemolysin-like protein